MVIARFAVRTLFFYIPVGISYGELLQPADKHSAKERIERMRKVKNYFLCISAVLLAVIFCCSCSGDKTYSELTNELSEQYGIFLPDTAEIANEYMVGHQDSVTSLAFVVHVDNADELYRIFDEQMWSREDVESAIEAEVDKATNIGWLLFGAEDSEDRYEYFGHVTIWKMSADTYRLFFCGYC